MPRRTTRPERAIVVAVLEDCKGSVTAAAARLGISRRTLHRWIVELDIEVERVVKAA